MQAPTLLSPNTCIRERIHVSTHRHTQPCDLREREREACLSFNLSLRIFSRQALDPGLLHDSSLVLHFCQILLPYFSRKETEPVEKHITQQLRTETTTAQIQERYV